MAFVQAQAMAMGMPKDTEQATARGKAVVKGIDQGIDQDKVQTMVEGTAQADILRTARAKAQGTILGTVVEPLEHLDTIPQLFKRNQRELL